MSTNKVDRIIDCIDFAEQSDQTTVGTTFSVTDWGDNSSATISFEDTQKVVGGMSGGNTSHLPSKIVNLKHTPKGQLSFMPQSLTFFKYFIGGYSDDGSDYTINNTTANLPTSLTLRGNLNSTEAVRLIGTYFNDLKMSFKDEEIVMGSCSFIGLFPEVITATTSYDSSSVNPMIYANAVITIGGTEFDLGEFNFTMSGNFMQKWGINTKASNKKRLPTQIVRGAKTSISFDGVANLTESATNELETIWGGSTPSDTTSEVSIVITVVHNSKTHTITITGAFSKAELNYSDSEQGSKTLNFAGNGRNITIGGEL